MRLAERTQACMRQMANLAEAESDEWLCYWAEYLGLTGQPAPTGCEGDERIQRWYERGREDRDVLLGLQSVTDAQT